MRIEPSPSPLVPPELASPNAAADPLAGTPFASLLADDTGGEPAERALTFVELGMFGAYAGVSPARLALALEEQAQESGAAPEPSPASLVGGRVAPGVASISAADEAAAKVDSQSPSEQSLAEVVTEARPVPRLSEGFSAPGAFSEPSTVVDEAAPVTVSLSRTSSAPAPAEVRLRTASQPSFEDFGLGAAPEKGRVPKQATGRAPLAAVLVEEGGSAKLAVAAAALPPGGGARLRALAARLLAEHGLELGEMWINGGSEPASAAQGEGHGSRTD
jgi:hypothetical protein